MHKTFGLTKDKNSLGVFWHWRNSITWRWIFRVAKHDKSVMLGFHHLATHQGQGSLTVLNTRLIDFSFTLQPNMFRQKVKHGN